MTLDDLPDAAFLTTNEVAVILRRKPATISELARAGKLKRSKDKRLYEVGAVRAYLGVKVRPATESRAEFDRRYRKTQAEVNELARR